MILKLKQIIFNIKIGKGNSAKFDDSEKYEILQCAKFRGSRAIEGFMDLVPSCYRAKFFLQMEFRGSETFSRWYFVDPKFFLMGVSWVQNFFS